MKISELVYDVLLEEVKNKKLFNFLLKKWFGDQPTDEQIEKCEEIINTFAQSTGKLSPNSAAVISFLDMYDGNHGSEYFDGKFLKDITKYSLKQINSLLDEFKDSDYEIDDSQGKFGPDQKLTEVNIEASKKMWEGDENLIINEGTLRVYKIDSQSTSMKYGYYQQMMAQKYNGNQWCVTGRGAENQSQRNLWGSYRGNRTFYFVIDESKKPTEETRRSDRDFNEVNKYYLCALQVVPSSSMGYMTTSMVNEKDEDNTWEKIIAIYPQLATHKDELVPVKYDVSVELDVDNSIFARITETPGSQYEFRRMPRQIKKAHINNGASIKTLRSWESMDKALKDHYIGLTTQNNFTDRFQDWQIMNDIRKNTQFVDLDNRLKTVNVKNGVGAIFANLMSSEFNVSRQSLDNNLFVLYESRNTHKFGLYNTRSAKWIYEPLYKEINLEIYSDDSENSYVVETYSQTGEADDSSFYCVFPINSDNENAAAHFITFKHWAVLSEKMHTKDDDDSGVKRISDFNPETDVDLKESIKRRK